MRFRHFSYLHFLSMISSPIKDRERASHSLVAEPEIRSVQRLSRYAHRSRSAGRKCTRFYDTRRIRRHAPSPHLPYDAHAVCADDNNNNNARVRIVAFAAGPDVRADVTRRVSASARPSAIRPPCPLPLVTRRAGYNERKLD